jgi:hypothetical protein
MFVTCLLTQTFRIWIVRYKKKYYFVCVKCSLPTTSVHVWIKIEKNLEGNLVAFHVLYTSWFMTFTSYNARYNDRSWYFFTSYKYVLMSSSRVIIYFYFFYCCKSSNGFYHGKHNFIYETLPMFIDEIQKKIDNKSRKVFFSIVKRERSSKALNSFNELPNANCTHNFFFVLNCLRVDLF